MFFSSITLGEHKPLIAYLNQQGVRVTNLFRLLVKRGPGDPVFSKTMEWLTDFATSEWFDTPEDAAKFLDQQNTADALLSDKAFAKLNFGFLARLILNRDEYDAYYRLVKKFVKELLPGVNVIIIEGILEICRRRNFFTQYMADNQAENPCIKL